MSEKLLETIKNSAKYCRDPDASRKAALFSRALRLGNVGRACQEVGKPPRYYYYWWNRYRDAGFKIEALKKKSRRPKTSPRKIPPETVRLIKHYRKKFQYSPEVISLYLERERKIRVSKVTVYRVLLRERFPMRRRRKTVSVPAPPSTRPVGRPRGLKARRLARQSRPTPIPFRQRLVGNRFLLQRPLGLGGGGVVYLARDERAKDREVALKVLEFSREPDPRLAASLKNEFSSLSALRHRHLARVFDFGLTERELYFSSEYVAGENILEACRHANLNTVFQLTVQMLRALDFLHSKGVLHLDLKPENILVTDPDKSGELSVKLIDFGTAEWRKKGSVFQGEFVGTPPYAAPEVILEQAPTPASDIYSLGMVLHQIFAQRFPFSTQDPFEMMKEQVYGEPLRLQELHPALPENFADFLHRLVAKEPASRFASPREVLSALNQSLGENFSLRGTTAPAHILEASDFIFPRKIFEGLVESFSRADPQITLLSGPTGMGKSFLIRKLKETLQLRGIHPVTIHDSKSLETWLRSTPAEGLALFIDLSSGSDLDMVPLLDRLENSRQAVLITTPFAPSPDLNPTRWVELPFLGYEQIFSFLEQEVIDFPVATQSLAVFALCQGHPMKLETVLHAMHEEGLLQWTDQGWRWVGDDAADFSQLLVRHETRWQERRRHLLDVLQFSRVGLSAKTLEGILNLEPGSLDEKLVEWEKAGLILSKKLKKQPHYFSKKIPTEGPTQLPIRDWSWAGKDLEELYARGAFGAGVELARLLQVEAGKKKLPASVALLGARHYVAAGFADQAMASLPPEVPEEPTQAGLFVEIQARAWLFKGEFPKAQALLVEAEKTYRRAGDQAGTARVDNLRGSLLKRIQDFSGAAASFTRASEAAKSISDAYAQGLALMNLGILYYDQGKFEKAQATYRQAFELERTVDQPLLACKLRENWVNLVFYMGRSAEAEAACYDLLKTAIKFQYHEQQGAALNFLSLLAGQKSHYEMQLNYLNQAMGLLDARANLQLYFQTLTNRAYVHRSMKKFTAAQLDGESALELAERSGNTTLTALANLILGKVHRDRPKPDLQAASVYLNNAHQLIYQNKIEQLLWEVELDRGLVAKLKGEKLRAKNYFLSAKRRLEVFLQQAPESIRQNYLRDRQMEKIERELADILD